MSKVTVFVVAVVAGCLALFGTERTPLEILDWTAYFMSWWHLGWGSAICALMALIGLAGLVASSTDSGDTKGGIIAVACGFAFMWTVACVCVVVGATYLIHNSIEGTEIVNQTNLIVGSVLYFLMLIVPGAKVNASKD